MSESQNYEEVTVASDGVTVIKTFEADAFPVPAIAFRIKSERSESVTVTLTDDVPEDVAVEDLGFHPEYGSEFWTIDDDEITFEREIEADEQYTTVYGIRATGTDDVEQFLTEPTIEEVDPPLDDDEVVGTGSDVVRDVISGDTDAIPGLDEEGDEDDDIGTLDLADPNADGEGEADDETEDTEEGAADDEAEDTDEEAEEETAEDEGDESEESEPTDEDAAEDASDGPDTATNGSADVGSVESVASALADEIRAGEVPDDDLELLADELDLGGGTDAAVDARIEKLQTDVSDLEAYIDALEEFLEDNGTGQDLIEDVQSRLDDLQTEVSSFESDIQNNNQQVDDLDDAVRSIEDDVQSLKGDIKDLDDDVSDLEDDLGDIDDLDAELEDIQDELDDLQDWRDQLGSVLGGD